MKHAGARDQAGPCTAGALAPTGRCTTVLGPGLGGPAWANTMVSSSVGCWPSLTGARLEQHGAGHCLQRQEHPWCGEARWTRRELACVAPV